MSLDLNDKSSNGNTLTNSGAAEVTTSLPFATSTEAVDFELTESDNMTALDSASLSVTGDLTLECWVKFESTPGAGSYMIFIDKGENTEATNSYAFGLENSGGTLRLFAQIDGGTTENKVQNWTPSTGTWYHTAFVFTAASSKYQFFVDGSQVGVDQTGAAISIQDSSAKLILGAFNSATPTFFFDGVMDEVRIWSMARTATQLNDNKSIELVGNEANLVAYWPFETQITTTSGFFAIL